jgi:isoleucyl-tRNA synthetase
VVVATPDERAAVESMVDLVQAELNVKGIEFVSDEADVVRYTVKPNYRALGPRFGKAMPSAAAAIEALDPSHVAEMQRGERQLGVNVDGREHPLEPEDVTLAMEPLEGYQVEAEAGHAVALSLELDDELRREGLAREIVRAVQNARKEAGFDVTDRISLELGGDGDLLDAARAHQDYLAGETLATSVSYDHGEPGAEASIEGRTLHITVTRD